MAVYKSYIEWHDLRIAPDDIPEEGEEVLVTKENYEGTRRVVANVYLKWLQNGAYCWCTMAPDDDYSSEDRIEIVEETMVWDEVIAWAYYPKPHVVF